MRKEKCVICGMDYEIIYEVNVSDHKFKAVKCCSAKCRALYHKKLQKKKTNLKKKE